MIRAGQNLPDKEFRYLRTVIVTADIHGGLDRKLAPPAFTFPHWSHVTPYTSSYDLAESCVFAKQSVGPLHCGPSEDGHPLYRRYRANLSSSLRRFNSRALEYSSRIPVSVCGTGFILEAFLGSFSLHAPSAVAFGCQVTKVCVTTVFVLSSWGRNINRLCIDYSLRPRLSSRLTQGRRTLPWKPYPYGDVDFNHIYRYSCLDNHF